MYQINFGIKSISVLEAARLIIGHYFPYTDDGTNLTAHFVSAKDDSARNRIFGDRPFISFSWEGPSLGGLEQYGIAYARLIEFGSDPDDEGSDEALKSLVNLGEYLWGYREVLGINEDRIEACTKLFDQDDISDLVHYVKTQKNDPSSQNRVYLKVVDYGDSSSEFTFLVVDQNMGYGY